MIRVGLTQRVDVVAGRGERRDATDQRWFSLLRSLGILAVPIPNDTETALALVEAAHLDGFILTGGNDIAPYGNTAEWAPERDNTERNLLRYASIRELPVLGVCRGMQMLNLFEGGTLSRVDGHVALRHLLPSFRALGPREVNSFHSFGITLTDMSNKFSVLATAPDGTVEAARHTHHDWVGIMWHPERESTLDFRDAELIIDIFGVAR